MDKQESNWKEIFIVCIIIITLGLVIFYLCDNLDIKVDNYDDDESLEEVTDYRVLDGMEALSIGRELYDKTLEIYSVWELYPYCGYNISEINSIDKIMMINIIMYLSIRVFLNL